MTLAEVQPLFAALVTGAGAARSTAPPPTPTRTRSCAATSRSSGQRALLAAVLPELGYDAQSWRLDDAPHPFAQSPGPGDVRLTTRYRDARPRLLVLQRPARVRPRALRRQLRPGAAPHAAVRLRVARRPRVPVAAVGERHRPRPAVQRLAAAAAAAAPARALRRDGPRDALPRPQPRAADADPHGVRRDDLQPPRRAAARARAGAARGTLEADGLPAAWNEGMHRLLGVEVPGDREGVLQDVHWAEGIVRLLPDVHARQPDGGAAVGAAARRRRRRRRADRARRVRARSASGCASTSTATGASTRSASCCAARRGRSSASSPTWPTSRPSCATAACSPNASELQQRGPGVRSPARSERGGRRVALGPRRGRR